jgi:hypothetical protein
MSKDAYYFSHDSNARNDEKMLAVRMRFGAEGYGIYFMIIERLRESRNYLGVTDYNVIAFDLRVSTEKVKSIVEDFGLFEFTDNGRFYSKRLSRSMNKMDLSKVNGIRGNLIRHGHITKEQSDNLSNEQVLSINDRLKEGETLDKQSIPPESVGGESGASRWRLISESHMKGKEIKGKESKVKRVKKKSKKEREIEARSLARSQCTPSDQNLFEKFLDYWTESGLNDLKLKFEKQKSFDWNRRWQSWQRKEEEWKKKKVAPKKKPIDSGRHRHMYPEEVLKAYES